MALIFFLEEIPSKDVSGVENISPPVYFEFNIQKGRQLFLDLKDEQSKCYAIWRFY
jgi:hypothetical protein